MNEYKKLLMENKRYKAFLFVLNNHISPEIE